MKTPSDATPSGTWKTAVWEYIRFLLISLGKPLLQILLVVLPVILYLVYQEAHEPGSVRIDELEAPLTPYLEITYFLGSVYVTWLFIRWSKSLETLKQAFQVPSTGRLVGDIVWGALASLAVLSLFVLIVYLLKNAEVNPQGFENYTAGVRGVKSMPLSYGAPVLFWISIIGTCVLSPILEEIWYRGVMLEKLKTVSSGGCALIFVTVIFAFSHLDEVAYLAYAYAGLTCGAIYLWRRSLYAAISAHIVYNVVAMASSIHTFLRHA